MAGDVAQDGNAADGDAALEPSHVEVAQRRVAGRRRDAGGGGGGVVVVAGDQRRQRPVAVVDEVDQGVGQRLARRLVVEHQFQQRRDAALVVQLSTKNSRVQSVWNNRIDSTRVCSVTREFNRFLT